MGQEVLPRSRVVVAGDVTMDWHIACTQGAANAREGWDPGAWARACWQRGGAALLGDLIGALAATLQQDGKGSFLVEQPDVPREPVQPCDARHNHTYAIWSQFSEGNQRVWRVERFLGLDPSATAGEPSEVRADDDTDRADLVVLDDAALGFRDLPDSWPPALMAGGAEPWVLLKMARPVAHGRLWRHLQEHHASRLVVVTTANDLRRTEVQISQGLSWERTAQDVAWELVHNPRVSGLGRCAAVVVSIGAAGAVLLSRLSADQARPSGSTHPSCRLFFDPPVTEGTWEADHPGGVIGYTTCLAASVARQMALSPGAPDLDQAIQSGLAAMRALHMRGFGEGGDGATARLVFPVAAVARVIEEEHAPFSSVDVQDPVRFLRREAPGGDRAPREGWWTVVEDRYRDNLDHVAARVVTEGVNAALRDVPQGRFGHLLTVDRREIESFRSIHALASEYLSRRGQKRPLSIGVFGAPGSGKSFGITQVAQSLAPGQVQVLEFNLSQFEASNELADALHLVRDTNLSGKIPLVFWDEFDAPKGGEHLGWLRHFLAPMQDGSFREGQVVHPIGRSIFVFAGGTSHRMVDFGSDLDAAKARAAKLPDFVSRLKGYVDVLGPNPREPARPGQPHSDPYFVVRRAILLRSILERNVPGILAKRDGKRLLGIDPGVLRAFLRVREFKHGIRSMESIVAMSQLADQTAYERSSLPSEAQLDLHVDGLEFLALVQQMNLAGELLEKLAEAAHEVFRSHTAREPYFGLSEEDKEQNRSFVRDIPEKLARIGYVMIPARSDEPPFEFPPGQHLVEVLARLEHERWMQAKLDGGWQPGPETDRSKRIHACIAPWENLPPIEKEKDEILVKAIPRVLAEAGYTVVSLRRDDAEE